jgi:hypothetical protein
MAALDFPASPSLNQQYTANGSTWTWDGTSWLTTNPSGGGISPPTDDNSTNSSHFPLFVPSIGNTEPKTASTKLFFNPNTGTLNATTFNSLSDQALKINTETLVDGLKTVIQLNPVSFNWKDTGQKAYGVIAQEIENVIPEIVVTTDTIKSVSYDQIIPFLIQAVKELKIEIEELKSRM